MSGVWYFNMVYFVTWSLWDFICEKHYKKIPVVRLMQTDIQMCWCRFPNIAPLCDNKWHVPFSHFISVRNIVTTEKVLVGTELTSNKMTSSI